MIFYPGQFLRHLDQLALFDRTSFFFSNIAEKVFMFIASHSQQFGFIILAQDW